MMSEPREKLNLLSTAIELDNVETMKRILDRHPALACTPDQYGSNAIHKACACHCSAQALDILLQASVTNGDQDKIGVPDSNGMTPLFWICSTGNFAAAKSYLTFGCVSPVLLNSVFVNSMFNSDIDGQTCVEIAFIMGYTKLLRYLYSKACVLANYDVIGRSIPNSMWQLYATNIGKADVKCFSKRKRHHIIINPVLGIIHVIRRISEYPNFSCQEFELHGKNGVSISFGILNCVHVDYKRRTVYIFVRAVKPSPSKFEFKFHSVFWSLPQIKRMFRACGLRGNKCFAAILIQSVFRMFSARTSSRQESSTVKTFNRKKSFPRLMLQRMVSAPSSQAVGSLRSGLVRFQSSPPVSFIRSDTSDCDFLKVGYLRRLKHVGSTCYWSKPKLMKVSQNSPHSLEDEAFTVLFMSDIYMCAARHRIANDNTTFRIGSSTHGTLHFKTCTTEEAKDWISELNYAITEENLSVVLAQAHIRMFLAKLKVAHIIDLTAKNNAARTIQRAWSEFLKMETRERAATLLSRFLNERIRNNSLLDDSRIWMAAKDHISEQIYFYNKSTRKVSWLPPPWLKTFDHSSKLFFYTEIATRQSSWSVPEYGDVLETDEDLFLKVR